MSDEHFGRMQAGVRADSGMQDSSRDAFRRSAAFGVESGAQAGDQQTNARFGPLLGESTAVPEVRLDEALARDALARLDGSLAFRDSRAWPLHESSALRDAEARRLDAASALRNAAARMDGALALQDAQERQLDGALAAQSALAELQSSQQALQAALTARDKLSNIAGAALPDTQADGVLRLPALEARLQASLEATEASSVRLHRQALERLVATAPVAASAIAADEARTSSSISQSLQSIASVSRAAASAVAPIEIVIGRIEIHASEVEPQRPLSRAPSAPPAAALPLSEYLRRREGRGP